MRFPSKDRALIAVALGFGLCGASQAGLPAAISGDWFNPEQSGHGLSVQILAPDRALVFWYTYDAQGNPFNLYVEGRIQGRQITATALAPRGMRFGSFDPADMRLPEWGTVTLSFDSCDGGRLSWQANAEHVEAFGSGEIPIVRLSATHAEDCSLGNPALLASDVYDFEYGRDTLGFSVQVPGIGAVDRDGRIWAMELLPTDPERVPGPTFELTPPEVLRASIRPQGAAGDTSMASLFPNAWLVTQPFGAGAARSGEWMPSGSVGGLRYLSGLESRTWQLSASNRMLVKPLAVEQLVRTFQVALRNQFTFEQPAVARLRFERDGSACIDLPGDSMSSPCRFSGRYWLIDSEAGFFDFELTDQLNAGATYRGRGWMEVDTQGEAVVLIGDNGYTGMAFKAR
jgi:hypothetical protein